LGRLSQSLLPTAQVGQVGGWRAPPPFALIVSTAGLCGARAATRRAARAIAAQSLPSSAARCQLPVGKLRAPRLLRMPWFAEAPRLLRIPWFAEAPRLLRIPWFAEAPRLLRIPWFAEAPRLLRIPRFAEGSANQNEMQRSGMSPNFKTSNGALKLRFRPRRGALLILLYSPVESVIPVLF